MHDVANVERQMLYLGRGGGWDMLFLKSTTYLLVVVHDALILFVLIVALILAQVYF